MLYALQLTVSNTETWQVFSVDSVVDTTNGVSRYNIMVVFNSFELLHQNELTRLDLDQ